MDDVRCFDILDMSNKWKLPQLGHIRFVYVCSAVVQLTPNQKSTFEYHFYLLHNIDVIKFEQICDDKQIEQPSDSIGYLKWENMLYFTHLFICIFLLSQTEGQAYCVADVLRACFRAFLQLMRPNPSNGFE